jgi:hypothetical protein
VRPVVERFVAEQNEQEDRADPAVGRELIIERLVAELQGGDGEGLLGLIVARQSAEHEWAALKALHRGDEERGPRKKALEAQMEEANYRSLTLGNRIRGAAENRETRETLHVADVEALAAAHDVAAGAVNRVEDVVPGTAAEEVIAGADQCVSARAT